MSAEDYLGFVDPSEARAAQGPAFVSACKCGPRELILLHDIFKAEGGSVCLFLETDDTNGSEEWSVTRVPDKKSRETESQGARWRRIMGWPKEVREPTFDEVRAWRAHSQAKTMAKYAAALAEAVRLDAAEGFIR